MDNPCLVLDFKGNAFMLFPLSLMLAVGFFIYDLCYVEVCLLYSYVANSFLKSQIQGWAKQIHSCSYGKRHSFELIKLL